MKNDNQQTMIELLTGTIMPSATFPILARMARCCAASAITIDLITAYARDNDWLSVEEAVHNCTGKLAGFFGL